MNFDKNILSFYLLLLFQFNSFGQVTKDSISDFYQLVSPETNQIVASPFLIKLVKRGFSKDTFLGIEVKDNSDHVLGGKGIHLDREEFPVNGEVEVSFSKPFCQTGKIKITRTFPTEGVKSTKEVLNSWGYQVIAEIPIVFSEPPDSTKCPNLVFENYLVPDIYDGKIATVNFNSYPAAWEYRTRIKEAVTKGVNYAGNYIIAQWGCGSSCGNYAIIDGITGLILAFDSNYNYGLSFKNNSRLLIIRTKCLWTESVGETCNETYYELKNNKLFKICSF